MNDPAPLSMIASPRLREASIRERKKAEHQAELLKAVRAAGRAHRKALADTARTYEAKAEAIIAARAGDLSWRAIARMLGITGEATQQIAQAYENKQKRDKEHRP